jgi:hypothetical protein
MGVHVKGAQLHLVRGFFVVVTVVVTHDEFAGRNKRHRQAIRRRNDFKRFDGLWLWKSSVDLPRLTVLLAPRREKGGDGYEKQPD